MECSTIAGDTARRNKGSAELAAIALAWLTGWLLSEAPEVWPDIIVEKGFLVWRKKQLEGGKTPCSCVLKCGG